MAVGALLTALRLAWTGEALLLLPAVLLVALAGLSLIYDTVARTSVPATVLLLICVGFCIYGPDAGQSGQSDHVGEYLRLSGHHLALRYCAVGVAISNAANGSAI